MANGIAWARMVPEVPRQGGSLPLGRAGESRAASGGQSFADLVDGPDEAAPSGLEAPGRTESKGDPVAEAEEIRTEEDDADSEGAIPPPDLPLLPRGAGEPRSDPEEPVGAEEVGETCDGRAASTRPALGPRLSGEVDGDPISWTRQGGPANEGWWIADEAAVSGPGGDAEGEAAWREPGVGTAESPGGASLPDSSATADMRPRAGRAEVVLKGQILPDASGPRVGRMSGPEVAQTRHSGRANPDEAVRSAVAPEPAASEHPLQDGSAIPAGEGEPVQTSGDPGEDRLGSGVRAAMAKTSPVSGDGATLGPGPPGQGGHDVDMGSRARDPSRPGRKGHHGTEDAGTRADQPDRPVLTIGASPPGRIRAAGPTVTPLHGRGPSREDVAKRDAEAFAVPLASVATGGPSFQPAADPPMDAYRIARQVATHPTLRTGGSAEMTLAPEELGHLRLSVEVGESGLRVVIEAARPETADLMRRHVEALRQELRQEGLGSVSVSIGGGEGQRGDSAPDRGRGGNGPAPAVWGTDGDPVAVPAPALPTSLRPTGSAGRIDLRF